MQIQNSEVGLTSNRTFYSKYTNESSVTSTPCLVGNGIVLTETSKGGNSNQNGEANSKGLGGGFLSSFNYCLNKNGQVEEVENGGKSFEDASSKVKIHTLNYLLRLLLFQSMEGDVNFDNALSSLFQNSTKRLVTRESTSTYEQSETTDFSAVGTVNTADGRQISFSYSFEMSSYFKETMKTSYTAIEEASLVDPLVINLDSNPGEISDQKFYFDLDCDGNKEEISNLGEGKGFLAYDKNEDGIINNGRELFGTESNDGFGDLAKYDEDNNGWIDEGDKIFSRLKILCIENDGSQKLLDLKEADIGAIYLGKIKTNFTNYDSNNEVKGIIRESGIYLHESTKSAGAVTHLDLAT